MPKPRERFNPTSYRDELAKRLKEAREKNPKEAPMELQRARETLEYQAAKSIHRGELPKERLEILYARYGEPRFAQMIVEESKREKALGALLDYAKTPFEQLSKEAKKHIKELIEEYFDLSSGFITHWDIEISRAEVALDDANSYLFPKLLDAKDRKTIKFIIDGFVGQFLREEMERKYPYTSLFDGETRYLPSPYYQACAYLKVGDAYCGIGFFPEALEFYISARLQDMWGGSYAMTKEAIYKLFEIYRRQVVNGTIQPNPGIERELEMELHYVLDGAWRAIEKTYLEEYGRDDWKKVNDIFAYIYHLADKFQLPPEEKREMAVSVLEILNGFQRGEERRVGRIDSFYMEIRELLVKLVKGDPKKYGEYQKEYKEKLRAFLEQEILRIEKGDGFDPGLSGWKKMLEKIKKGEKVSYWKPGRVEEIIAIKEELLAVLKRNLEYLNSGGSDDPQLDRPTHGNLKKAR